MQRQIHHEKISPHRVVHTMWPWLKTDETPWGLRNVGMEYTVQMLFSLLCQTAGMLEVQIHSARTTNLEAAKFLGSVDGGYKDADNKRDAKTLHNMPTEAEGHDPPSLSFLRTLASTSSILTTGPVSSLVSSKSFALFVPKVFSSH